MRTKKIIKQYWNNPCTVTLLVHYPVFDAEYAVIRKWEKRYLPAYLTIRSNIKTRNFIFDKITGLCINKFRTRKVQQYYLRNTYKTLLPFIKKEDLQNFYNLIEEKKNGRNEPKRAS